MAFLTIAGTSVSVDASSATERAPTIVGDPLVRAFDGTGRSTARAIKRQWTVTTPPLTFADAAAVRALFTPGVPVACGGTFLTTGGTTTVSCLVTMGESPFVADFTGVAVGGTPGLRRRVTLTLDEL